MFKLRLLTAIALLVALSIILKYCSFYALVVILATIVLLIGYEWCGLSADNKLTIYIKFIISLGCLTAISYLAWRCGLVKYLYVLISIISGCWGVGGSYLLLAQQHNLLKSSYLPWFSSFACWGFLLSMGLVLHHYSLGNNFLYPLILIVCSQDIGAYVVGRLIGRHALAPRVSPAKTWEGLAGGMLLAVIAINIYKHWLPEAVAYQGIWLSVITCLIAGYAVLGDLIQSLFKRYYNVKDSGNILPGHGGVWDRLDSFVAATPSYVSLFFAEMII